MLKFPNTFFPLLLMLLQLGTLLPLATQPMITTVSPSYSPDFQASNLLNSNLLKAPDYTVS